MSKKKDNCEHCWEHRHDKAELNGIAQATYRIKYTWKVDNQDRPIGQYVLCEVIGSNKLLMKPAHTFDRIPTAMRKNIAAETKKFKPVESMNNINAGYLEFFS